MTNQLIHQSCKVTTAYAPKSITTASDDTSGTAIDTTGYSDITFLCSQVLGTSETGIWTVKSSATSGGTYAAITGATVTVANADSGKSVAIRIDLRSINNYSSGVTVQPFLKIFPKEGTGSNASVFASIAVLNFGAAQPVTQDLTAVNVT